MSRNRAQRRIAPPASRPIPTLIGIVALAVMPGMAAVVTLGPAGCVRVKADESATVPARQVDLGAFTREEEPETVTSDDADDADNAAGGFDEASGTEGVMTVLADGWRLGAASPGVDATVSGVGAGVGAGVGGGGGAWLQPGDAVLVDAMVGQVNGRPIFADDFFDPIEDRLIAESGRSPNDREFTDRAAPIIMSELRLVVINALFLAEAQAGLTPMEEQGIRAWLHTLKEEVVAEHGGSEEEARRRILEEEARTLEQRLEEERDRFLIQRIRYERIAPRIVVSWRDVEREYRRDEPRYNPPPRFTLWRIRLAAGRQADEIEEVTARLAAGEPFTEIAGSVGKAGGLWDTFEAPDGDLSQYPFGAEVQAQVGELRKVGDTVGPFPLGTRMYWLHVVEIERPPSRSLFDPDLQRELIARIRSIRVTEEEDKYISTLLQKGIYDELNEMVNRLMAIALHRYGPRR